MVNKNFLILYSLALLLAGSCSVNEEMSPESATDTSADKPESVESENNGDTSAETENKEEEKDANEEEEEDFTELELLSEAIRSYDAGRFMISKNFFEKMIQKYPGSPLSLTAELKVADCLFFADRFTDAIPMYREFAKVHSKHEARPYALFQIAQSFQNTYQGTSQDLTPLKEAIKQYVSLINEYPASAFTNQASTNITKAEEDLLKSELAIIDFYVRTGDEKSAQNRSLELRKLFGHLDLYKNMFPDLKEESGEELSAVEEIPTPSPKVKEEPSTTPSEETPQVETLVAPSPSPAPRNSGSIRTLADLEEENTEPKIPAKKEEELPSLKPLTDKPNTAENAIQAGTFLKTQNCELEDGILTVFLKFSSKPFLKTSRKDKNDKNLTTIIFQEGFTTDTLPGDSNDNEWVKGPSNVCLKTDTESVSVQEIFRDKEQSQQFGPKSYLFVYINSPKINKVSIVNGSSPDTLAIVAQ